MFYFNQYLTKCKGEILEFWNIEKIFLNWNVKSKRKILRKHDQKQKDAQTLIEKHKHSPVSPEGTAVATTFFVVVLNTNSITES